MPEIVGLPLQQQTPKKKSMKCLCGLKRRIGKAARRVGKAFMSCVICPSSERMEVSHKGKQGQPSLLNKNNGVGSHRTSKKSQLKAHYDLDQTYLL